MSAFNWRGQPSIFSNDKRFTGLAEASSQTSTKNRETGKCGHESHSIHLNKSVGATHPKFAVIAKKKK